MSAPSPPRWTAWRPGPRRFFAVVCGLLFAACAAALALESSRRRAIAAVAGRPGMPALAPAVLETAGIVEESDGAALIVAEGFLDAGGATAAAEAARDLALETAERRPGSVHARLLLGRAAAPDAATALWKKPLELASEAAPGLDPAAVALAQRYLAVWGKLGPDDRLEAETAIARAFLDPTFLRSAFSLAIQRLGPETAVRMVPDGPGALDTASRIASASGSLRTSELLAERRKSAGPQVSRPDP
jgi:hypothetical protein